MNSKLLDKILHCREMQIPADMALGIVSLYFCGKKSSNEELRGHYDNWQEENGDVTY